MKEPSSIGEIIKDLRNDLTQAEFAKRLGVSQGAVSAWERDDKERAPSADIYFRLAALAPYPKNLWFLKQAGIESQAIVSVAAKILEERSAPASPGEVIRIPRFRLTAEGREEAGPPLLIAAERVPNPGSTICLVLDKENARPAFSPGDIVALDTTDSDAKDLQRFRNQVVLAEFTPSTDRGRPGWMTWPGKLFLGRLRFEQRSGGPTEDFLAILGPLMNPESYYSGEHFITVGRWRDEGPRSDRPSLRVDRVLRAAPSIRLFDGCRILGRVIGWFPAPSEKE